jgi:hypothetical protein
MSDKLTIQQQQRGLSPKDRRRLSELGYTIEDINKQGLQNSRAIIKNSTVKPGATDRGKTPLSKQQRLNLGAKRLNKSLLPKLEKISQRTGIPLEQLKTGTWEINKYYNLMGSEMRDVNTYVGKMNSLKKRGWVPVTEDSTETSKVNGNKSLSILQTIQNQDEGSTKVNNPVSDNKDFKRGDHLDNARDYLLKNRSNERTLKDQLYIKNLQKR